MTCRGLRTRAWCVLLCALAFVLPAAAPAVADPAEDDPQASARDPDYAAGKRAWENKN